MANRKELKGKMSFIEYMNLSSENISFIESEYLINERIGNPKDII
jgi:hypothetical protein